MKTILARWRRQAPDRLSSKVLGVLIAVAAVLFALFWLVGFDRLYDEDPNFTAPLFTDVLIVFMELLTAGAVCCGVWSMVRAVRTSGKSEACENNVPVKKIGRAVLWGTVLLLVLTFALGSSAPMSVNGVEYADAFWLKAADMLIVTSLVLMAVAVGAMLYGATKYIRRSKHVRQA